MLGDRHLALAYSVLSERSRIWPYCQQLVVRNKRNGVKIMIVLYPPPSLTAVAWPDGMTRDEAQQIVDQSRSFVRSTVAHTMARK